MIDTKTQFITDDEGNRLAVILPIKKYYELLEDEADVALFDEAKHDEDDGLLIDDAFKLIEQERQKNNL